MHDYAYYDALGVTYEPVDAYDYDKTSMAAYEYSKTLEVLEFLQSVYIKANRPMQDVFAQFLDNAI